MAKTNFDPPDLVRSRLAPRRQLFAWAMFDFANSGYTTVVLTAIFSAYFVNVVAGSADGSGTFYWTLAIGLANLVVLVSAPVLGAMADGSGHKKRFLFFSATGCVTFTLLLATVGPGDLVPGMVLVSLATIMFSAGENFIAAFLPEISPPEHMGRVSGFGWGLGYLGGIAVLGVCLAYVSWASGQQQTAEQYVPITMLITGSCFALAASVTFIYLPERAPRTPVDSIRTYVLVGFRRTLDTIKKSRRFRDLWWALSAMAVYQCGIYTVVVLAAVYASEVMGFTTSETIVIILVVNLTAAAGAFLFGQIQDRLGSVRSLQAVLLLWVAALLIINYSEGRGGFWWAANLIGLAMGASQSGGRALVGRFSPVDHAAEFFGLWGLATKFSAIVGPLVYGGIMLLTRGDHNSALLATTGFFVLGLVILGLVDEVRGQRAAKPG